MLSTKVRYYIESLGNGCTDNKAAILLVPMQWQSLARLWSCLVR